MTASSSQPASAVDPAAAGQGISRLIPVELTRTPAGLVGTAPAEVLADGAGERRARWLGEQLERGHILFFACTPFALPGEDREFLLRQRQTSAGYHKNVAYRPAEDRVTGLGRASAEDAERTRAILRRYSDSAIAFLAALLPCYAADWRRDFASFRPIEERGRQLALRARNDLLHTDAFPTRPTRGDRILRIFTNLNPCEPRVWLTGETFEPLARRFARDAGLPRAERGAVQRLVAALGRLVGAGRARQSPYDRFMLRFHNFLKENAGFQCGAVKNRCEFPPDSTWVVFTDMVSHAVLSGQFALEQTVIVPRAALLLPHKAPIAILEQLCGYPLASA